MTSPVAKVSTSRRPGWLAGLKGGKAMAPSATQGQPGVLAARIAARGNINGNAGIDADEADQLDLAADPAEIAARQRERNRIMAILAHPVAMVNRPLAQHLALFTDLSRRAAIATLKVAAVAPVRHIPGLAERMARERPVIVGPDAPGTASHGSPIGLAAAIISARDKARSR
jgi:hypothetical protein